MPYCQLWLLGNAHAGGVNEVKFSPSGSLLASVGEDKHLKVWANSTGNDVILYFRVSVCC